MAIPNGTIIRTRQIPRLPKLSDRLGEIVDKVHPRGYLVQLTGLPCPMIFDFTELEETRYQATYNWTFADLEAYLVLCYLWEYQFEGQPGYGPLPSFISYVLKIAEDDFYTQHVAAIKWLASNPYCFDESFPHA